jgi:penicillin-binding protein 1A
VADKFDHVQTARRQSGSVFKPFVYVAAIDNGYSPHYRLRGFHVRLAPAPAQPDWIPRNSGGTSGQYLTLREPRSPRARTSLPPG